MTGLLCFPVLWLREEVEDRIILAVLLRVMMMAPEVPGVVCKAMLPV